MWDKVKKTILPAVISVAVFILMSKLTGYGCLIRRATGFSCPGCGMTRAYIALLSGDIRGAFYYHPLFLLPIPAAALIIAEKKIPPMAYNISMAVIASLFIAVYITRMAKGSPVLSMDIREGSVYKIFDLMFKMIGRIKGNG